MIQSCDTYLYAQQLPHPDVVRWCASGRPDLEQLEEWLVRSVGAVCGGKVENTWHLTSFALREFSEIFGHGLVRRAIEHEPTSGDEQSPGTQMLDSGQLVTHIQDGAPLVRRERLHPLQTLRLKRDVADRENLVHDQDLRVKVSRDRKASRMRMPLL